MKVKRRIVEIWYLKNDEDRKKLASNISKEDKDELLKKVSIGYMKTKDRTVIEKTGEETNICYMRTEKIIEEIPETKST